MLRQGESAWAGLSVRPVTSGVSESGLQSVLGPHDVDLTEMLGESDCEALNHCGAGRPEANSGLHKWTADGPRLDGSASDYF